MIHRILLDSHFKVLGGFFEVPADELNDSQGIHYLSILGLQDIGFDEGLLEVVELKHFSLLEDRQSTEVRVKPQPVGQVLHCFLALKLVGAGDAQAHQAVEVVRVCFVSVPQGDNRKIVLIIFLEENTQQSPGLRVVLLLLNFGLEAKNGFLYFTLVNQHLRLLKQVCIFELVLLVFVVCLELYDLRWSHHSHGGLLVPNLVPFVHHLLSGTQLPSLLLPCLHHFCELLLGHHLVVEVVLSIIFVIADLIYVILLGKVL